MEMNIGFGDWYRTVSISPTAEQVSARWAGIEAASVDVTASRIIDFARLYTIKPHKGYETPQYLDNFFRDQDTLFPNKGNVEEIRLLAGVILRNIIDKKLPGASAAAYGIVCGSFGNRRNGIGIKDHISVAERYLTERGKAIRASNVSPTIIAPISRARLEELMPNLLFNQPQNLKDGFYTMLEEISEKAAEGATKTFTALAQLIHAQREELDLLWWLQTSFSKDAEKPFADIGILMGSIMLPLELADLTAFVPGSPGIFGMIISALKQIPLKDDRVSIKAVVNSVSRDWRKTRVEANAGLTVGDLCPINLAMSKSLETDGVDDWIPAFKKQASMSADDKFEARDLSAQVYSERMFVRALSEMTK